MTDRTRVAEAFMTVHSGLPREGPGSRASTARALAAVDGLPDQPRVLDLGCGPGMQTLDLAELLPGGEIIAMDLHEPFVDEANRRLAAAGQSPRAHAVKGDMKHLQYPDRSFDLIWSEGAVYNIGVAWALESWRGLLKPGGRLAFTDAVWLGGDPPAALLDWWRADYPDMVDRAAQLERVVACGYQVLDSFVLPEADWWDDYYLPMQARVADLRKVWKDDLVALGVLERCDEEMEYYRRYPDCYGYLFVIAGH